MGGGKGSSNSSVQMTPEQTELLKVQTDALTGTFLPAYKETVGGAKERMNLSQPYINKAAENLYINSGDLAKSSLATASGLTSGGASTLSQLFSPDYEKGQVNAALQAGRESARESQAGQNAMYGAAGGLGSSRMALADRNLSSLNEQRQSTAAANASALVQQNRANAAATALKSGVDLGTQGINAAGTQVTSASSPMDAFAKYASIIYGTPQASTTPNFAGTQGQKTSSKGFGF
jgi:hypothetical protein